MLSPSVHWVSKLQVFSRVGAIVVACIGGTVLVGWLCNISIFKTGLPGLITMKANTAWGFLAAGLSLLLAQGKAIGRGRTVGLFLAVAVLLIGSLTLLEHIFQLDLGIDESLFLDDPTIPGVFLRGRMSPVTASAFILAGWALIFLNRGSERAQRWVPSCAVPVMLIAIQAVVGYAYGVPALYQLKPFSALALHTALTFWVLSAALLASVPTNGFMKIITSETAGGLVSRRLLPLIVVGLFVLGWLGLAGEVAGWYEVRFGVALMVMLSMAFFSCIVLWNARMLYRVDVQRSKAEAQIVSLNAAVPDR